MKIGIILRFVTLGLILNLETGCATSSDIASGMLFEKRDKTVFVSEHFSGYAGRHVGEVARVLEKHGFLVTKNRERSDYFLDFNIDGGATLTVSIGLLQEGKKLIEVESTNVWFGTVMFRPIAVANRVEAAIEEFDQALSKI
ncbi:hypothetical protein [Methylotuvimicrobium alcaliphilum]|uniref:Uncharacterized protein n=1 Tax=Methylotuvimicrobium alcaliphilum (strain DSM 19304 / NCIMB 14124 / VKM B-2133 / 20Z) TaxID=1091494 RepID=G4ST53_META2|nr:hypothetical protein [Methylotuvimicrobium alcaliphilum]CCE22763.1 protein of unknown function [Methylotuvimicrobium alcaliphilum 20Z]